MLIEGNSCKTIYVCNEAPPRVATARDTSQGSEIKCITGDMPCLYIFKISSSESYKRASLLRVWIYNTWSFRCNFILVRSYRSWFILRLWCVGCRLCVRQTSLTCLARSWSSVLSPVTNTWRIYGSELRATWPVNTSRKWPLQTVLLDSSVSKWKQFLKIIY